MEPVFPVAPSELGPTENLTVLCSADTCTHDPQHHPLPILFRGDVARRKMESELEVLQ